MNPKTVLTELGIIFAGMALLSAINTYGLTALLVFVAGLCLVAVLTAFYIWIKSLMISFAGYVRKVLIFGYTLLGTMMFVTVLNWLGFGVIPNLVAWLITIYPGLAFAGLVAWLVVAKPYLIVAGAFAIYCLFAWSDPDAVQSRAEAKLLKEQEQEL